MKTFENHKLVPEALSGTGITISQLCPNQSFTMIVPSQSSMRLNDWLMTQHDQVNQLLQEKGAILFRGFDIGTVDKFNTLTACFNSDPIPYMFRSSPRYALTDNVYVSTTYPSNRSINMHSESSYSYAWGQKIMFCCIVAPQEGGETPIADNRKVLKRLSSELVSRFEDRDVIYQRILSPHISMSWPEVFQTEDRQTVLQICAENGILCNFLSDTDLVISWKRSAIGQHPKTGEKTWFNHAFFFNKYSILNEMGLLPDDDIPDDLLPSNTFYGDGSEISYTDYLEIKNAYEAEKVIFKWQQGDVLLLDNMLTAHGRNPYKGDRKIVVAIMEPTS